MTPDDALTRALAAHGATWTIGHDPGLDADMILVSDREGRFVIGMTIRRHRDDAVDQMRRIIEANPEMFVDVRMN